MPDTVPSILSNPNQGNPVPILFDKGREPDTSELHREANYLNDHVDSINGIINNMPPMNSEDKAKIPDVNLTPTNTSIARAERAVLYKEKEEDPELYEKRLYEYEARAALGIEDKLGKEEASKLYDKVRYKAGEVMHTMPELTQKEAAGLAIATLFEKDENFKNLEPDSYGNFQSWALANIELNHADEARTERARQTARENLAGVYKQKQN